MEKLYQSYCNIIMVIVVVFIMIWYPNSNRRIFLNLLEYILNENEVIDQMNNLSTQTLDEKSTNREKKIQQPFQKQHYKEKSNNTGPIYNLILKYIGMTHNITIIHNITLPGRRSMPFIYKTRFVFICLKTQDNKRSI